MAKDDKIIITAEQAEGLLNEGKYVHNFISNGTLFIGCDFDRADAITAFRNAKQIEIGGEGCKRMKHPLAVFDPNGKLSFFEADMAKVSALEATLETA